MVAANAAKGLVEKGASVDAAAAAAARRPRRDAVGVFDRAATTTSRPTQSSRARSPSIARAGLARAVGARRARELRAGGASADAPTVANIVGAERSGVRERWCGRRMRYCRAHH